jgi:hypothetical protein
MRGFEMTETVTVKSKKAQKKNKIIFILGGESGFIS